MTAVARARRPMRLLISVGPTREPIDAVRYLSNYSSGRMGWCLAREALARGHRVTVVSGPTEVAMPDGATVIRVERARQMQAALRQAFPRADALIMAAAVSDFEPVRVTRGKLVRGGRRVVTLRATPDILARLPRRVGQVVAGFAVEDASAVARARRKLSAKRLDLIVAQSLNGRGAPFGDRAVTATLLTAGGRAHALGRVSKPAVARAVLDEMEHLWYGDRR